MDKSLWSENLLPTFINSCGVLRNDATVQYLGSVRCHSWTFTVNKHVMTLQLVLQFQWLATNIMTWLLGQNVFDLQFSQNQRTMSCLFQVETTILWNVTSCIILVCMKAACVVTNSSGFPGIEWWNWKNFRTWETRNCRTSSYILVTKHQQDVLVGRLVQSSNFIGPLYSFPSIDGQCKAGELADKSTRFSFRIPRHQVL